jgi:lipid II:glycine glycyltransferase (peptidoglycan interpeptide bridge formation enzyme)
MKMLDSDYTLEVDKIEKVVWDKELLKFDDATIYQTWSYGSVRWGESNLSHLVLKRKGEIISLAQLSIKKIPIVNCGIAFIPWGPVWKKKGASYDFESIRYFIKALREEYVLRRHLLIRITPNTIKGDDNAIHNILEEEKFVFKSNPYRTLLIDLSLSIEELTEGSARRWRRALKTAEKKGLKVIEGTEEQLYEKFKILYVEMVARKRFVPGIDINEFQEIQKDLPESFKMKIMLCEYEGEIISALIASLIGQKGVGLLGATGNKGMNLGGFNLLNWRMIKWMKERGALWYDFGGYNPVENPGTAGFKDGLPGRDVFHIGQFEACESLLSSCLVDWGERCKIQYSKMKLAFNEFRNKSRVEQKPDHSEQRVGSNSQ